MRRTTLTVLALLAAATALQGCARTAITTPFASYSSEKDIVLQDVEFEYRRPDGTLLKGKAKRIGGTASDVDEIQAGVIRDLVGKLP